MRFWNLTEHIPYGQFIQTTKRKQPINGNLYVFCDNLNCQRAVQGEINRALGHLIFNSYLTNLYGLRMGKRSEKYGGVWLASRLGR
jgi:hypothetical protein